MDLGFRDEDLGWIWALRFRILGARDLTLNLNPFNFSEMSRDPTYTWFVCGKGHRL